MTSPTLLHQLTDRAGRLYSLPAVAMRVLDLTNQPHVDVPALKACLENDPALTSKILKVVNSSLFGLPRKVGDLNQALALLGIKPLKMLVLGFSLPKELDAALETQSLSRYWRHALIKAVACRELAEEVWRRPGNDAFIAGLLQDIGKLVLVQQLGPPFQKFLNQAESDPRPLVDLELETLGFDHTILSSRLLEKWGLPSSLAKLVAQPADAARIAKLPDDERAAAQILHLGELIARTLTRRPGSSLDEILAVGQEYCDLQYNQLRDVIDSLEIKVTALGEILSLFQPDGPPFCEILAQAHAQLAELAEGAGAELGRSALPESYLLAETRRLQEELKVALANSVAKSMSFPQESRSIAVATKAPPATANESGLPARVQCGLLLARENRQPMSLLLVQIDRYADVVFNQGLERATWLQSLVQQITADAARDLGGECTMIAEARFAIVGPGSDRREGNEAARELLAAVRERLAVCGDGLDAALSLSIGLATTTLPSRNFPPRDLIAAAERCLYAAQVAGGTCVKSIEL